jgi:hypothetical protein
MNWKTLNFKIPDLLEDLSEKELFAISIYGTLRTYVSNMFGYNVNCSLFFMNTKKAAGLCIPTPINTIAISREYMNSKQVSEYDIYNTLLHELTHAAVGCHHGHNEVWQKSFKLLGGDGERCSRKCIDDDFYKYTIFCTNGCKWNRERLRENFWKDKCCDHHKLPLHIIKRN